MNDSSLPFDHLIENYSKDISFLTKKMNYVEIKKKKKKENDVFVLYIPERIKLQPEEIKIVDMKLHLKLSIVRSCVLLPSLTSQNIKFLNDYHISIGSLMLEDSLYRVIFEIQNRSMNETSQLKAKTELVFFTIINSGSTQEVMYKFIKCSELYLNKFCKFP